MALPLRVYASGAWKLYRSGEAYGMLGMRMRAALDRVVQIYGPPELVAYEHVVKHGGRTRDGRPRTGTRAAHIYGGIAHALTGWCEERAFVYTHVSVSQVKLFATGKGNASKAGMIAAARVRLGIEPGCDNEADACWIGLTAATTV